MLLQIGLPFQIQISLNLHGHMWIQHNHTFSDRCILVNHVRRTRRNQNDIHFGGCQN